MPRRKNNRANPPAAFHVHNESAPRPPKSVTHTDKKGRVWTVDFLKLWKHDHATYFERDVRSWEASHVGFTYAPIGGKTHQRVYRFQPGETRDLTPESIYTALLVSKRVPTTAEYAHKQLMKRLAKSPMPSMSERLQDLYDGRRGGMGRR
jgi:hypothetical protein